jgi:excisionase family DNA binding protein
MSDRNNISVREAASMLGVSLQQIYKLVWDGRFSSRKIDGKWRISTAAVQSRLSKKRGTK